MKLSEAFPSKFLKASDVGDIDDTRDVTIRSVELEQMGQGERKLVATLREFPDKGWIINKTNGKTLEKLLGPDTDDWIGERVTLFVTEVEYAGDVMPGIRVKLKRPAKVAKAAKVAEPADDPADDDDDIPF